MFKSLTMDSPERLVAFRVRYSSETLPALRDKISLLSQKTYRRGCGNLEKLNYGSPGKASFASRQHRLFVLGDGGVRVRKRSRT